MTQHTYDRIAVCLDGSPTALEALGPARRLARLHDACLWLVTVDDGDDDPEARLHTGDHQLGDLLADATVLDNDGSPEATLGRFDDEHPETLLCLTTRGRHPLGRALLGSVAASVVGHSSQAVALIGPRCSRDDEPAISRLIVALDTTEEAETALDWATRWSTTTATPLALVHVVYPLPPPEARVTPSSDTMVTLRYLPEVARRLRHAGHDVLPLGPQHPDPPEAIIDAAETFAGSVVFMATTDRHPAAQVVLGSATTTVVRGSPVPVVVTARST